jgi:hypothetical protein
MMILFENRLHLEINLLDGSDFQFSNIEDIRISNQDVIINLLLISFA